jgi:hypothetical protein
MASLVLKMSVSLDGYVAPVDGSTGWIAAGGSDDTLSWTVETVSNAGAHLMGATTYAVMAAHWPGASGPFAKPMNEIPKVVFSDSRRGVAGAATARAQIALMYPAQHPARTQSRRAGGYLSASAGQSWLPGVRLAWHRPAADMPASISAVRAGRRPGPCVYIFEIARAAP